MSLLDDLLDLARLDAHKILFTPEPVSVIEVVRDVLASVDIESRAKHLEIRVEVTDDALGSIRTDRFRLRQILVNVVANAVKFTESGSICVSLHATDAMRAAPARSGGGRGRRKRERRVDCRRPDPAGRRSPRHALRVARVS